ncbi:aromatic acid exporter family protein [Gracilibacillus caseinilyticus]|uniref:Aromatic acid exporter family protein n=1 Tax=Gracilibacillus caseinilyticus TaxID=2932256 RepID=A0ABY4EY54_9BACI|nr:aromatic acid exporter family protein [Gracilibacillus caseinilyticus]UOQ48822.1 aromatic acid exporter family protein [Gracilibacillus caseinilyticus]
MKLGARMLKTGFSITVALYIAQMLGLAAATYAGIAAAFAVQPNIHRSFQTMLEQIYANLFGVTFGVLVVYGFGNDPIVIGLTIIIVIGLCMYFKLTENTITLAILAVLAVMETTEMMLFTFAGFRFSALLIGILSASLINMLFLPPKYELRLFKSIDRVTSDILQWLRISTRHLSDDPALRTEIDRIQAEVRIIDNTYLLFSEERIYRKKLRLPKMRKLIIFRQMINTSKRSLATLEAFHQYDDKVENIPKEFQDVLVDELDKIIYSHERLLLSAMGKIKKDPTRSIEDITDPDISHLVQTLINVYEKDDKDRLALLPLAARLMEYHKETLHLQRILNSYQKFHDDLDFNFKKKRKNRRIIPTLF